MFEATAIVVTDGTQPCFPFLPPDFEEIERTVMIRNAYINEYLTHYSMPLLCTRYYIPLANITVVSLTITNP